jgi:hypothetical protein
MLKDKLEELSLNDGYRIVFNRLKVETERILAGAGDEAVWYELWNQIRTIEKESFGE